MNLNQENVFSKEVFLAFASNKSYQLPVERSKNSDYVESLKHLYKIYLDVLNDVIHDEDLVNSVIKLCSDILKIFDSSAEDKNKIMDEIIEEYVGEPKNHHTIQYAKKNIKGINNKLDFFSTGKKEELLKLYRATANVDDVKKQEDNEVKRSKLFHCPYDRIEKVSSTRYSMERIPSLYLSTSIDLSLDEIRISENTKEVFISQFKINRESSEKVDKIIVLEFGIRPQDFVTEFKEYEEDIDKEIGDLRIFKKELLNKEKTMQSYFLWYPLFAACSFIKKSNQALDPKEYVIPQLFLTRLNEKIYTTNILYGIRYFSCATKESYKKGFNYVFPVGENTSEIKNTTNKFSGKLIDSFTLTTPQLLGERNQKSISLLKKEFQIKEFFSIDEKKLQNEKLQIKL